MQIGLLIIATEKYSTYVEPLLNSADKYFLEGHSVTYFIFTNKKIELTTDRNVVFIDVEHRDWPWMTLGRYEIFDSNSESFSDMDYLFYCDVDMRFESHVGTEIISDRVATQHPGYWSTRGVPETRPESTAYVSEEEEMEYFAGGFNGGSREEFIKMSKIISKNILDDLSKGIIAIWHDESHLNRYFIDNKPTLILNNSYCCDEYGNSPFGRKLVCLYKSIELANELRSIN